MSRERTITTDFAEGFLERESLTGSIVCKSSKYARIYHTHALRSKYFHWTNFRYFNLTIEMLIKANTNIVKQFIHINSCISNGRWRGHVPLWNDFRRNAILLNMDACRAMISWDFWMKMIQHAQCSMFNQRTYKLPWKTIIWKLWFVKLLEISFVSLIECDAFQLTHINRHDNKKYNKMIHFTYTKFKRFKIISNRDGNRFAPVFSFLFSLNEDGRFYQMKWCEMWVADCVRIKTPLKEFEPLFKGVEHTRPIKRWLLDVFNLILMFFFLCSHWFRLFLFRSNAIILCWLLAFELKWCTPHIDALLFFGSARFLCHTRENTVIDDSESTKNSNLKNAYIKPIHNSDVDAGTCLVSDWETNWMKIQIVWLKNWKADMAFSE